MKRFKDNMKILSMEGGIHVLLRPDLIWKTSNDLTPEEFLTEKEKSISICILKRYGGNRYDGLL